MWMWRVKRCPQPRERGQESARGAVRGAARSGCGGGGLSRWGCCCTFIRRKATGHTSSADPSITVYYGANAKENITFLRTLAGPPGGTGVDGRLRPIRLESRSRRRDDKELLCFRASSRLRMAFASAMTAASENRCAICGASRTSACSVAWARSWCGQPRPCP